MEREYIPKLIGGIGRWELFPGRFIIGNIELDRYIRVPAESVEPVWRAIQYCDGNRSLAEIARLILASGWKFDVAGLYRISSRWRFGCRELCLRPQQSFGDMV